MEINYYITDEDVLYGIIMVTVVLIAIFNRAKTTKYFVVDKVIVMDIDWKEF